MTLNHQPIAPALEPAMRIANIPGGQDYWFDWLTVSGRLIYQRKPDGPRVELAQGIPDQQTAMNLAVVFSLGMAEASKTRMVPWPNERNE